MDGTPDETLLVTGRPPIGRPPSEALTARLLSTALDVLAEDGWEQLTFDEMSRRARAGKAGLYRRWPSPAALVEQALAGVQVVAGPPADSGSLRADLLAVLEPLVHPPTREQRAAAALLGAARTDPDLRRTLSRSVVEPLRSSVAAVFARSRARGDAVPEGHVWSSTVIVQALWWDRGTAFATPLTAEALGFLVDGVLVPPG